MKKLIILPFVILFLAQGCARFGNNEEATPPEFEYLIQELDSELDFDSEQRSSARASLGRGKDFHPDPAALWKLAAYLHENLTLEQKLLLLAPPSDFDLTILSEEKEEKGKRGERLKRMERERRERSKEEKGEAEEELREEKRKEIEGGIEERKKGKREG